MSDRCKLGDIAIIIKDHPGCENNIGRFVSVCGPRKISQRRGTLWIIKPLVGNTMTYIDVDKAVVVGLATNIEHEDEWLFPVRPEVDGATIEQVETQTVTEELEAV